MMTKQFKIKKILNNNAALGRDEHTEVILSEKGLGFKCHVGEWVTARNTLKVYYPDSAQTKHRFQMLFDEIPYEYISLTQEIIDNAEKTLNQKLNQILLITLADHIHFAVKRYKAGIDQYGMQNEEIKRFFPQEFHLAQNAISKINAKYQVMLADSEPSMIAFHIVNAEYDNANRDTDQIIKALNDIIKIVETALDLSLSEDSSDYSRLVIHLKFFLQKVFSQSPASPDQFANLQLNLSDSQSVRANKAVDQIAAYLIENYHYQLSGDERFYLIIHMIRNMN